VVLYVIYQEIFYDGWFHTKATQPERINVKQDFVIDYGDDKDEDDDDDDDDDEGTKLYFQ
jgi:hypothetical protein